ncbi:DUF6573 family protein [Hydrogenophaga sp.]|uniref:DUF6573 family protein n=1 Tax=Hydrogenophaga sp. TaxID=1904254 RepID=UPI00273224D4|nr:DUF6573 family protein [Hydrogenophaga sp.]MDP2073389.1 hypothetical protein [Hydrogenophaga sp.]MDP3106777.1 hypothetical protein [Hydrogenophaga sp.]
MENMKTLPLIHSYSRAQAVADGVLIDVSAVAREAGFKVPVALTAEVWADCVAWSAEDSLRQVTQDESGRLWDVLWMAFCAARQAKGSQLAFHLYRVPRGGRKCMPRLTTLHLQIGPGDELEPVITVLQPGQD